MSRVNFNVNFKRLWGMFCIYNSPFALMLKFIHKFPFLSLPYTPLLWFYHMSCDIMEFGAFGNILTYFATALGIIFKIPNYIQVKIIYRIWGNTLSWFCWYSHNNNPAFYYSIVCSFETRYLNIDIFTFKSLLGKKKYLINHVGVIKVFDCVFDLI